MKHRTIKEIETTPLAISILLWYMDMLLKWLTIAGKVGLLIAGLALLTIVLHAPYWLILSVIAIIAAADTEWIVYKAFKTNKLKRKKKGDKDESLN